MDCGAKGICLAGWMVARFPCNHRLTDRCIEDVVELLQRGEWWLHAS